MAEDVLGENIVYFDWGASLLVIIAGAWIFYRAYSGKAFDKEHVKKNRFLQEKLKKKSEKQVREEGMLWGAIAFGLGMFWLLSKCLGLF